MTQCILSDTLDEKSHHKMPQEVIKFRFCAVQFVVMKSDESSVDNDTDIMIMNDRCHHQAGSNVVTAVCFSRQTDRQTE